MVWLPLPWLFKEEEEEDEDEEEEEEGTVGAGKGGELDPTSEIIIEEVKERQKERKIER